ncbi:MAG: phage tail sheath family protein [Bacteroidota bacterium]
MITNLATPGVYIDEVNAFPNSVVQVATAIPAFIGYTPYASYEGKSYLMKPVKITSMNDFNAFFVNPNTAKQYAPSYYLTKQKKAPASGESYVFNGDIYTIEPDPATVYHLYNSVRLFFQNGGSTAYVVSTGPYGTASGSAINAGDPILNMNVKLADFQSALTILKKLTDVTMYVVPEATLLSDGDYSTLMQTMLEQSSTMQTSMSLIDVKGGRMPDPMLWGNDIQNFRNWTGNNGLNYGAAYYPFLKTTITTIDQVDYTNINGGDVSVLMDILNPASAPNAAATSILNSIKAGNSLTVSQNNQALMMSSKTYTQILTIIQDKINTMPPSGVMAGIYSMVDAARGVWVAPANVSPIGVTDVTINLDDNDQAGLNVDAVSGKSVNAFRFFNGQGILIWGARTLDGNSQDWRYIPVRRTVTMIEQSIKEALRAYVFYPNDSNTWVTIKAMLENFLTNVWKEGALQGSKPEDAFSVSVGLGTTMTAQDILDGYLRVTVMIAVTHPAEFIVVTVEQQLAKS